MSTEPTTHTSPAPAGEEAEEIRCPDGQDREIVHIAREGTGAMVFVCAVGFGWEGPPATRRVWRYPANDGPRGAL
ncbi:MAG: hypothetical protein JO372_21260 [Solirubrobacterales bacterium]|nr:hypothetical protein [Solirubrobacterales bacterium]